MHIGFQGLQPFLMCDSEMLLFIDDHKSKALELDALGKDGMCSDHNIDGSICKSVLGLPGLCCGNQARKAPNIERKALEPVDEILVMLTSKKGRWTHKCYLPTRHRHNEGSAQRDLGLAESDIPANQAIHRPAGFKIRKDLGDRTVLIIRFLVGKPVHEGRVA